jgi:predicted NBD/HSP70 family sugar kinase
MSIVASEILSRMNERRVLEYIQRHGPKSRPEIVRGSGLSSPTVSKATDALIGEGLLEEAAPNPEAFGRPAKTLRLSSRTTNVLGVVIDAGVCTVDRAGFDGLRQEDAAHQFPTADGYEALLEEIQSRVEQIRRADPQSTFRGIGVSVPGLLNLKTGQIETSPNLHLLDGQNLQSDLQARLGLRCIVLQESHALCLGERFCGPAHDIDDFVLLDMSTGLGMGVVSNGQLLTGSSGLAGEIGHITINTQGIRCGCGNVGCLETVATDTAFVRRSAEALGRQIDLRDALKLYRDENPLVRTAAAETSEWMAIAMSSTINIFNPSQLVIHSQLLHVDSDLYQKTIASACKRSLRASFRDCRVHLSVADKRRGAIAGIIQHLTDCWAPSVAQLKHSVVGRSRFSPSEDGND